MNGDKIAAILGSIVTVSLVTTILMRGTQAAQVFGAVANGFSQAMKTAQGR
jgi:hypothetical protein